MDDLELEGRLRTRLHARFDDAPIPDGLVSSFRQAVTTEPRRFGATTRVRSLRLGWAAVAAVVVVSFVAIGIGNGLGQTSPGGRPTPSLAPTTLPDRVFVVLPPTGTVVPKPDGSLAIEILNARIRALGIGNFESAVGDGIEFFLPADGPTDASIRAVLAATGDVQIIPLPAADYGEGKLAATIGSPLPKAEPVLIGWEGIASVTNDPLRGVPEPTITLKAAAAQAFGDYTTAHVGEPFAIVVDGRVAMLPMVLEPITSGQITVSPASGSAFAETTAILVGGMLPAAWRGASVPVVIARDAAVATALAATGGGTLQAVSPSVERSTSPSGDAWQVVWNVEIVQPACSDVGSCASSDLLVKVDGVTGKVLHIGAVGS